MLKGLLAALQNIVIAFLVFSIFYLIARGIRLLVEWVTTERRRARNPGLVLGRLSQGMIVLLGLFIALPIIFPQSGRYYHNPLMPFSLKLFAASHPGHDQLCCRH